jgi:hypothetical protein
MSEAGFSSVLVWLGQAGGEGFVWTIRELPESRPVFMTTGSEEPDGSSQSTHSSGEAGNDRGAKECRKEKP